MNNMIYPDYDNFDNENYDSDNNWSLPTSIFITLSVVIGLGGGITSILADIFSWSLVITNISMLCIAYSVLLFIITGIIAGLFGVLSSESNDDSAFPFGVVLFIAFIVVMSILCPIAYNIFFA